MARRKEPPQSGPNERPARKVGGTAALLLIVGGTVVTNPWDGQFDLKLLNLAIGIPIVLLGLLVMVKWISMGLEKASEL